MKRKTHKRLFPFCCDLQVDDLHDKYQECLDMLMENKVRGYAHFLIPFSLPFSSLSCPQSLNFLSLCLCCLSCHMFLFPSQLLLFILLLSLDEQSLHNKTDQSKPQPKA